MKKLIVIGAGGHGKVVADIAIKCGYTIEAFLDDEKAGGTVMGLPVLGTCLDIPRYADEHEFIIAIGSGHARKEICERYQVSWATLVHPLSSVGWGAELGEGTVVMAGAVINADAKVGKHCIINSGAVVEHDNLIGNYSHISPNAALAGTVCIGERVHVGIGSSIKNNLTIADDVIIGAGAVVVEDIVEHGTYVGVPAYRIKD